MTSKGKLLAVIGSILQIGYVVSLGIAVAFMIKSFAELSQTGQVDEAALAESMAAHLYLQAGAYAFAVLGAVLMLIALWFTNYRSRWFQAVLWASAILWLISLPVGTVMGIVMIIYLVLRRNEFAEHGPAGDAVPLRVPRP